jgi:hypothetical protein
MNGLRLNRRAAQRAAAAALIAALVIAGLPAGASAAVPAEPTAPGPLTLTVGQRASAFAPYTHAGVQAHYGTTIGYRVTVTNTSGSWVSGVDLAHPDCGGVTADTGGFDGIADTYASGQSVTFVCSHTLSSSSDPGDTYPAVASAIVDGTVTATDAVLAYILKPALSLVIEQRVGSADFATDPIEADAGTVVDYRITVTNSGNALLKGGTLSSPQCSQTTVEPAGFTGVGDTYAPGQSAVFRCSHLVGRGINTYVNDPSATAYDNLGRAVSAEASAVATVLHPALTLAARQARSGDLPTSDQISVHTGDTVDYEVVVTNPGDAPITADLDSPGCEARIADTSGYDGVADGYPPGATVTFSCSHTLGANDFDPYLNAVSLRGRDPTQALITAGSSLSADVLHPQLSVRVLQSTPKRRDPIDTGIDVVDGDLIGYTITVKNVGDVLMQHVRLTPSGCSGLRGQTTGFAGADDTYKVAQSATFECSHQIAPTDPAGWENVVSARGVDPLGTAAGASAQVAAAVNRLPPGQAEVRGMVFDDKNGNSVLDDGDPGFAQALVYLDANDNGARDTGELATTTASDGYYRLRSLPLGPLVIRLAPRSPRTCSFPKPCERRLSPLPGEIKIGQDFGISPPAESAVLGQRIAPGTARLYGRTGCVSRALTARVRGQRIAGVTFVLDRRRLGTVRTPRHGAYAITVRPKRLKVGVHRLVAQVRFKPSTTPTAKTLRLSFQRCRGSRAPRFTD